MGMGQGSSASLGASRYIGIVFPGNIFSGCQSRSSQRMEKLKPQEQKMTLVWFLTRHISWAAGVLLSVTERREKEIEVPQRLAFGWSNGLQERACICLSIVKAGSGGAHSQGREIRALLHSTKCSLAKRWTNAIGIQKMYY